MRRVTLVLLVAYIVVVGFGENVFAAEINVNSIAELNTAIANASAGDTLILADGTYTDQGIINFFAYGTENNPITVRAQTPGGVVFTGSPGYFITMTGEYLILTGFHFQDLSGVGVTISLVDADNCRVTDCYFDNCDQFGGVIEIRGIANNYLSFVGPSTYNQIDHCIFSECENVNIENFIVDVESYPAPDLENIHNKIDHCIFQNTAHSTIQNGRGSSLWGGNRGYVAENAADAYLIVEYSYFTGITAQKSIESKSSSNTYRYNFFENNVPGELSLRGGDDCIVEGNFFYEDGMRNTGLYRGIKISGTGHIIRNNYLEGATSPTYDTHLAIVLQWGQSDLFYQPVSNVLVANNVIRNTNRGYAMYKSGSATMPPTNCTWVNNIGESSLWVNPLFGYGYAGTDHTWISNRGHVSPGYLTNTLIPPEGVIDSGTFELTNQKTGLLLNWYYPSTYTDGTYNAHIIDDIEGQTRANPPDIGCDEDDGAIVRPMIGLDDVGVQWGIDSTPPTRINPQPNGTLPSGSTSTNISLSTNVQAVCRYSNVSGTNYTNMESNFTSTNSTNHSALVSGLENGQTYTFYVRCNSSDGYVNDDDFNISFSIDGHKADLNDDGLIDMPELMLYLARWKSNDGVTKSEVEKARWIWFMGGGYSTG